jgi:circadian clock protein KaiC
LLAGGPGCGKTLLALESLVRGARDYGDPGIFVAFEESAPEITTNAASFQWDLPQLQRRKLFFLDARIPASVIQDGGFDLQGLLAGLDAKVAELGAKRIVFDGINSLLSLLNDPIAERREMYRLRDWLTAHSLTGIVTCKLGTIDDATDEREGYLQYLADCLVLLELGAAAVPTRRLRVVKCRGVHHATAEVPFAITASGLEVAAPATTSHPAVAASSKKLSTGVPRLDAMLRGGVYRGASVLLTGAAGTAKSTIAGAMAEASARRGESTLYVTLDESESQIVRNMASVNIQLAPHLRSGRLRIAAGGRSAQSAIEDVTWIIAMAREHRATCIIVDPMSSLAEEDGIPRVVAAKSHLVSFALQRQITLIGTAVVDGPNAIMEASADRTQADTWIHLSYVPNAGERNRALTIVKSRGVGHSNQIRELILTDRGLDLADAYVADGEVLMGTLRWQKERDEAAASKQRSLDVARDRRALEVARAEAKARLATVQQQLDAIDVNLKGNRDASLRLASLSRVGHTAMRRLRAADGELTNGSRRGSRSRAVHGG